VVAVLTAYAFADANLKAWLAVNCPPPGTTVTPTTTDDSASPTPPPPPPPAGCQELGPWDAGDAPKVFKRKPNNITIGWSEPLKNRGFEIKSYNVQIRARQNGETRQSSAFTQKSFTIFDRRLTAEFSAPFDFRYRANSKIGSGRLCPGEWSPWLLDVNFAPAPPPANPYTGRRA